jgi:hypothetical protein
VNKQRVELIVLGVLILVLIVTAFVVFSGGQ